MATHSSILAWKIPWTEEPGRLQSMASQRVGHNWVTSLTHSMLECVRMTPKVSLCMPAHPHVSLNRMIGIKSRKKKKHHSHFHLVFQQIFIESLLCTGGLWQKARQNCHVLPSNGSNAYLCTQVWRPPYSSRCLCIKLCKWIRNPLLEAPTLSTPPEITHSVNCISFSNIFIGKQN